MTDREVSIGPSKISEFLSAEYNRRFPRKLPEPSGLDENSSSIALPDNYFYPRLQYKVVRGAPMIAAIGEGCELLWEIYDKIDNLPDPDWPVTEKRVIEKQAPFGCCDEYIKYRFLTPWLSLPNDLFNKFLASESKVKEQMLCRALDGYLKSISKSLGYEPKKEIRIKFNAKDNYIFQRDIRTAGLFGSFIVNFEIPNFLGIGKSVSRGYGAIKRV
jgi:hypothetical protein